MAVVYRLPCVGGEELWETDVLFLAAEWNSHAHTVMLDAGHKRWEFLAGEYSS